MIHLPDTNAFSAFFSGKSPSLAERMTAAVANGSLRLSVMVLAELEFGARKAERLHGETRFVRHVGELNELLEVVPLGADFPAVYAAIRLDLESAGRKIGDRDTIIAAHAMSLNATLITHNIREFCRIDGLSVEDWQAD